MNAQDDVTAVKAELEYVSVEKTIEYGQTLDALKAEYAPASE